ncbi:hypothetical protein BDV95DRAFT_561151 [Massariosphaeria phaeospora]|uniref:Zn(2)-C6 fungal-type domain-containing protein n=1 Tax=Massariosphaeria phaeospora TaxID=100035 RepID=A0A7C8IHB5_9PLEO|nr:hypothetical protein BDV95DRAFT_561151 [Massariosphaeria phaeospora]
MPAATSRFQDGPDRKRRAHAKSRKGCANCKLRRVKCDEARPQCRRCTSYGVSCGYDGTQPSLDLTAKGSFQVELSSGSQTRFGPGPQASSISTDKTLVTMINQSLHAEAAKIPIDSVQEHEYGMSWNFTATDLEAVHRFANRTVLTIGTARTFPTYQDCMVRLAFAHPFLMHMVLSLTLLHDAYLTWHLPDLSAAHTHTSLQHWSIATKVFNDILSRPVANAHRDPIWATGALLGATVFAYVEPTDANEAWPLKPSDPCDLDWLKLSEGKKAIWEVANPLRPDSVFRSVASDLKMAPRWVVEDQDLSYLPLGLLQLFNIGPDSTIENNPYHLPALILARLQNLTPNPDNILDFLYFMGHMTHKFRNLLEIKDPRALWMLGWWFKKLEHGDLWWLTRRAKVEGRAIQIWLDRRLGREQGTRGLLGWFLDRSETDATGLVVDDSMLPVLTCFYIDSGLSPDCNMQ